jgi:hypothetical protein
MPGYDTALLSLLGPHRRTPAILAFDVVGWTSGRGDTPSPA